MNNYLMLNGRKIALTAGQVEKIRESFDISSAPLGSIKVGKIAKIGDLEFIVLQHIADTTLVLLRDFWKTSQFDRDTNNYYKSSIRKALNTEFYNVLSGLIGKENIVKHYVDLTADDGRIDYVDCEDYVSLLTCDMYRKYVYTLEAYNPDKWWWVATARSTESNNSPYCVRCVNGNGSLANNICNCECGVRPFCILKSDIFVSR